MRDLNIAWVAGLFEGEGCISVNKPANENRTYQHVQLRITSTDKDVLDGVVSILGGNISNPRMADKSTKPFWQWCISSKPEVYKTLLLLYPYLSSRRSAKADEALEVLRKDKRIKAMLE